MTLKFKKKGRDLTLQKSLKTSRTVPVFPLSPMSFKRHHSLQSMSHQNTMAAVKIQSHFRGYFARVCLWKFGGRAMVASVLKIQRLWRGHRGRRIAAIAFSQYLWKMATRINGLYRCWYARRLKAFLRAEKMNTVVIKLQSFFRSRRARALFKELRRIYRNKMALKIERGSTTTARKPSPS